MKSFVLHYVNFSDLRLGFVLPQEIEDSLVTMPPNILFGVVLTIYASSIFHTLEMFRVFSLHLHTTLANA